MRFGDIRAVLDKYTEDCVSCDSCDTDCSYYYVKQAKEEILGLLDKTLIETSVIDRIPCKISYKGTVTELPKNAEQGDVYLLDVSSEGISYFEPDNYIIEYIWLDGKWELLRDVQKV